MKDVLVGMLFLWAKENQDIQYKQGLNEVLAIVVFAFFAERLAPTQNLELLSAEDIASSPDRLCEFFFDARHTFADIYSIYARILSYGVRNLY